MMDFYKALLRLEKSCFNAAWLKKMALRHELSHLQKGETDHYKIAKRNNKKLTKSSLGFHFHLLEV